VLDYKTGGFWLDDWKGVFKGGRRLQHALYGLAAVELLRGHHKNPIVASSLYYFSSQKGRQQLVRIAAPSLNDTRKVLGDLREVIVTGAYTPTHEEKDCRFCDYVAACDERVHDRTQNKSQGQRLVAYGRLAAHV
jgi:CRISPR/Cas system-associated exonuclease Cas4 (RecB family)